MIEISEHAKGYPVFLYTLSVSGKNPFYIGKTKSIQHRYNCHLNPKQKHNNQAKRNYIQSAIARGEEIIMTVFAGCTEDNWKEQERYWITKYKYDWQIDLLNVSDGGNGIEFTDEVRGKMSKARLGKPLSQQTKNNMKGRGVWNKGLHIYKTKHVGQYNSDGELVATFRSIKQAGETLGINRGCISLVVNGKRQTLAGMNFKYIDDGSSKTE